MKELFGIDREIGAEAQSGNDARLRKAGLNRRADAELAGELQTPAVGLQELLGQRQADSSAFMAQGGIRFDLFEWLERPGNVVWRHADTGISGSG